MKIPKGFIKDSEGIYRRGNFVFKDNKIFRESAIVPKGTIEEVADNYTTASECIRAILAFPASIGEKPRTTDIYVNKVGNNFKQSDKFTKDTVAIVTSDRNVIDIKAKDISDSTEFKDLVSKDKPVKAKEIRSFSSDKAKDSQEVIKTGLKESAEGVQEFWDKFDKGEIKIGDTFANGVKLIDANKRADYIVVFRKGEYVAAWAPELSDKDLVWGQGHYFDNEEDAKEYFNSKLNESAGNADDFRRTFSNNLVDYINKALSFKASDKDEDLKKLEDIISSFKEEIDMVNNDFVEYIKSNMNESEKLKESTKFYCTEEPDAYLELQNLKTIKNSAGKVLDVNTHGLVQNGDTVYVVTSDSDLDTVKVYSVDYQFPYVFKAGKKEEGGNE